MKKILYHGSPHIIQKPIYGHGKSYNDYGLGFYCTEHLELAKEWACTLNTDGYVNKYEIDLSDLAILNLSDEKYSILHWLTLLIEHRQFRIESPIMKLGCEWLKNNYHIDLSPYDIIIGYQGVKFTCEQDYSLALDDIFSNVNKGALNLSNHFLSTFVN